MGPHGATVRKLFSRQGATRVRVFGSVARGDAGPNSDVDFLVSFRQPLGLLGKEELREKLERLLGRPVDLVTEAGIHWYIRPEVVAESVDL